MHNARLYLSIERNVIIAYNRGWQAYTGKPELITSRMSNLRAANLPLMR